MGAYASSHDLPLGRGGAKAAREVREQIAAGGGEMLGLQPGDADAPRRAAGRRPDGAQRSASTQVALRSLYDADQHQIAAIASHITAQVAAALRRALRGGGGRHRDGHRAAW